MSDWILKKRRRHSGSTIVRARHCFNADVSAHRDPQRDVVNLQCSQCLATTRITAAFYLALPNGTFYLSDKKALEKRARYIAKQKASAKQAAEERIRAMDAENNRPKQSEPVVEPRPLWPRPLGKKALRTLQRKTEEEAKRTLARMTVAGILATAEKDRPASS